MSDTLVASFFADRVKPYTPRLFLRDIFLPVLALFSVFLLPFSWIIPIFLVMGQAHFFIAFLYQYRGGKVDRRYIVVALVLFLLSVAYFTMGYGFYPIYILAVFLFAFHFAYDEFGLHKEKIEVPQVITLALFVVLFMAMTLYNLYPPAHIYAIGAALVFLAYAFVRLFISSNKPQSAEQYLWIVGGLLVALTFFVGVRSEILLALVSILHILNWYMDYGRRIADSGDQKRLGKYWTEVVLSLVFMTLLYGVYVFFNVSVLQYIFVLVYYYAFAITHFILSALLYNRRRA